MKFAIHFFLSWVLLLVGLTPSAFSQNPLPASPPGLSARTAVTQVNAPTTTSTAPEPPTNATQSSTPAAAAASGDYVLSPSDTIEMSVFRQPDLTTRSPIASDGSVQFPLIGEVKVGGLALRNAREVIRKRYNADYLVEPQVYLNVVAYAQRSFTILGQVAKPGTYNFPGGKSLNLLEAVGIAGGFTRLADRRSVSVKRDSDGSEHIVKAKRVNSNQTFELQPNDVITVGESWF